MKKYVLSVLFVSAFAANASFIQETCNDGIGYFAFARGHVKNYLRLAKRTSDTPTRSTLIDFELRDMNIQSNSEIIFSEVEKCEGNFYSYKKVYAREMEVSYRDGSTFSEDIYRVSLDGKTVKAIVKCELEMNSRSRCD